MHTASTAPFSCDLTHLDHQARAREQSLLAWFQHAYIDASWTGTDYQFTLVPDARTLADVGELLALERLCCPFLRFALEVDSSEVAVLKMSGRDGVHEFIRATFVRE